jgi:hypothetical protein
MRQHPPRSPSTALHFTFGDHSDVNQLSTKGQAVGGIDVVRVFQTGDAVHDLPIEIIDKERAIGMTVNFILPGS